MAEGPPDTPAFSFRTAFLWTELFRCFQVALDPRKLLAAALGILAMSLGWYFLSLAFDYARPLLADEARYNNTAMKRSLPAKKPDNTDWTEDDLRAAAVRQHTKDVAEWEVRYKLAGDGGLLRTLPWYEYRGPNPYLLVTTLISGTSVDIDRGFHEFLVGTVPVLVEPLRKLLIPVVALLDPNATFGTRCYCLLCLIWAVAVWAFFGGVITRIAAVQFANKDRIDLKSAVQFVAARYLSYVLSPLVPLGVILVIVVAMALYGMLALIPGVGDLVLYGLGLPLVVFGGIAIAVLLVGLVGYPLMYTTLSAEGTDTFDALSRSYNYVFQAIWSYLWYSLVAVAYGALVTLFVVFMGSTAVYLGKWAVSQAPLTETTNRSPDYLFVYAPESFGWKELLLKGSPAEVEARKVEDTNTGRVRTVYADKNVVRADEYRTSLWGVEKAGAGMATFWLVLVLLFVIGFSYSYFWTASTMIYLLMRKKVDETDLDEIYVDDEKADLPYTSPGAEPPTGTIPGGTSLPVVPPTTPPASYSPPATGASTSYSPPPASPLPPLPLSPPLTGGPAETVQGGGNGLVPASPPVPTSDELKKSDDPTKS